jgi:hypothetical protein
MALEKAFIEDFDNLSVGEDDVVCDLEIGISQVEGYIAQSQKKGPQLYHEGYYYRIQSESKGEIKWRCTITGKKSNCKAKCTTTTKEIGAKCVVEIINEKHNHHLDQQHKLIKLEQRRLLKEKALQFGQKPRTIIHDLYPNLDDEQALVAPSYQADYMALWRERKKNQPDYPPSPKTLNEINFPDWLLKTVKREWVDGNFVEVEGDDFLIYASPVEVEVDDADGEPVEAKIGEELEGEEVAGEEAEEIDDSTGTKTKKMKKNSSFFLFGTEKSLRLIENSHIYCDGTFDIAPLLFHQVYTIHTIVGDKCVPVLYAFLPRKTKTIYKKMLEIVKSRINFPPRSITSDFESAFINAAKEIFPDSEISLCFFHFKQSLFRKIQNLGLVTSYMEDDAIALALKIPQAIAYIPVNQVWETFHDLKDRYASSNDQVKAFYDYIEDNYVGKIVVSVTGRRYKKNN